MAKIKPLNTIPDIKLRTLEDIADNAANEVRDQVRNNHFV